VAERDDGERRDRDQRAAAAAAGAALGSAAGPVGAIVGAWLGPKLEPLVRGVWAELSESARQRQTDVLFWAIRNGVPVDEMEERINTSERTRLLTAFALSAATQTAWEDKVRTLGRSLAAGLLADDDAKIDTEQMIIAAIADIEGPQLAMLELLVCWLPDDESGTDTVDGPLDIPKYSRPRDPEHSDDPEYSDDPIWGGNWHVGLRQLSRRHIAYGRPNLASIAPSLLGTLQRHGLVVQNDNTGEAMARYSNATQQELDRRSTPHGAEGFVFGGFPTVPYAGSLVPDPTWSPTELGEQIYLRFRDADTELEDVWKSGSANRQEAGTPSGPAGH
jgi:hypothetical protein